MEAYRRVNDFSHLQADCLYTGISPRSVTSMGSLLPFQRDCKIHAQTFLNQQSLEQFSSTKPQTAEFSSSNEVNFINNDVYMKESMTSFLSAAAAAAAAALRRHFEVST